MLGKLIVLYGVNNLGKTTQTKLLVRRIEEETGNEVIRLKYARYDVEPSGKLINEALRENNPCNFSPRELQMLQVLNRTQTNGSLAYAITEGSIIVAEDYTGTGIAWGMAGGVSKELLIELNSHLVREDLAILLDGERFSEATESGHLHEENDSLTERCRRAHLELARDFGWRVVDANQSIEKVHEEIWNISKPVFSPSCATSSPASR